MQRDLSDLRQDYTQGELLMSHMGENPFVQFAEWFEAAGRSNIREPNAMTLATASADGQPHARIVLLKSFDDKGFVFYTNYQSDKGKELADNPRAALLFFWDSMERQVRLEGTVSKVAAEVSTAYFQSRPRGSQLGAWASPQSSVIANREVLEKRLAQVEKTYAGQDILPRPPHWGGYILLPHQFEFWQGRANRLHDRIRYRSVGGSWFRERLAP
ncbi:MAG: pyridoxamine 5'-phosphate oxidase [Bacteroidetes bacterium]|nr:MAG: pyridoxamine 5'-phosphate oxidase [Bacteroidota bacterium]